MSDTQEDAEAETLMHSKVDLDTILINEIGQFGRYQIRTLALVASGVVFAAFTQQFIFTSAKITSRCLIPECEDSPPAEFVPSWIYNAIPEIGGSFDNCQRYGNSTIRDETINKTCPASLFDASSVQVCKERVYENNHTVVYDFDLGCDEWRRSLNGFVRMIGTFAALPFTGYISDRWGRRTALAINCFNSAWLGLTRYWVTTYTSFLTVEFVETLFGSGSYSSAYILILELVGPESRVFAGAILISLFTLGTITLGLIAWAIPYWRHLTLALHMPQLITIGYFWFIPESVRWNISKGRYTEFEAQLKEAARVNRKKLSDKSLQLMRLTAKEERKKKAIEKQENAQEPWLILQVFRHKQILIRCIVLPVWWVTMTLVYYGLSINSVNMSGNKYVNFVAVAAIGIPGYWISMVLLSKIGRKLVLMGGFWICAASQFAYIFVPKDMHGLSLFVFMVGKCAICGVGSAVYVYTNELYPTKYRHNLFAFASMVGRVGSTLSPLTPAIAASTFEEMPFVLFGVLAFVSGCLVLLTPETLGCKLPDTMEEAENLGLNQK